MGKTLKIGIFSSSSLRPRPYKEEKDGFYPHDADGNGIIAQMRIEDGNGQWRVSKKDPRAMVKRKPNKIGGKYYTIMVEGKVRNFDGVEIKQTQPLWGLDMNRNYAVDRRSESVQRGAGPYPFSEPKSTAVAEFISTHENIAIGHSLHATGEVILRPPVSKADKEIHEKDLKFLKHLGAVGKELTGYECVGIHDVFASC